MKVATGIDLPWPSPGGSVELLRDLYLGESALIPATAFMLRDSTSEVDPPEGLALLGVGDRGMEGESFWAYVHRLSEAVASCAEFSSVDVVHLQHMAFAASEALLESFPLQPSLALVHGTDILYARRYQTQREVLMHIAEACSGIVVPTNAMADILIAEFAVPRSKLRHIPWGVPDMLIDQSIGKVEHDGPLRLLYAGRLSSEKFNGHLFEQIVGRPDLQLCVAAPRSEWEALAASSNVNGVHYLVWLNRRGLWAAFQDMDLLLMPSSELEAFGLVAIEAQASGLPVAYQRVPGLEEVMGSSGIAVDFSSPLEVRAFLARIVQSRSILDEQVISGRRNSERFRLSDTAANLLELSKDLRR